jgi:hypothetical protein
MPFQLSPGVAVVEKDFSSIVPAVSSSAGAFAGPFAWGPIEDPVRISSETELVSRFGAPTRSNYSSFFTAANFLAYTNNCLVTRIDTVGSRNAVAIQTSGVASISISNGGSGYTDPTVVIGAPDVEGGVQATATAITVDDEITGFTITEAGSGYSSAPSINITDADGVDFVGTILISASGVKIKNTEQYVSTYLSGSAGVVGQFAAKYPGELGNSLLVSICDSSSFATWDVAGGFQYDFNLNFDAAPGTSPRLQRWRRRGC